MPYRYSEAGVGSDPEGDPDDYEFGVDAGEDDDGGVLSGDLGGDGVGRDIDPGPGLTESERELADELDRTRELESARLRFERAARDSEAGADGGRVGHLNDRDALAVIDAAGRFGLDEDLSDLDQAEISSITEALAVHAGRPAKDPSEYNFYAIIQNQTTRGNSVILTLKVPWEHRDEVFRALDTMPFSAMVKMTEIGPV